MADLRHTKPCGDCAFRRQSVPGWTGRATPEELESLARTGAAPCHKTVDYADPDWRALDQASLCAGSLLYLNNLYHLPRDPQGAAATQAVADQEIQELVFASRAEFIDHHRQFGRGSWDLANE